MNKKRAFTLAEVLITLGIIGVVAALTIPGLMTAYKAHQLHAKYLKAYSTIQQAFKQMEADDVSLDPHDYGINDGIYFYNVFARYVKPAKICFRSNLDFPCYNYPSPKIQYKNLIGTANIANTYFDDGQISLLDGTFIAFESPTSAHTWIWIDINGADKLPNRLGYDLFALEFAEGELKTMGDKNTQYENLEEFCNIKSKNRMNGMACAHNAKTQSDYFKSLVKEFK